MVAKKYDGTGRLVTSSEWGAISGKPDNVAELGALVDPAADALLAFNFSLGILEWIPQSGFSVTAADVVYTPPATGIGHNVQDALDSAFDALDDVDAYLAALDASQVAYSGTTDVPGPTVEDALQQLESLIGGGPTYATGTFTGTLGGVSGSVTGTVQYERSGKRVTLKILANIQGTSNSDTLTLTGIPAGLTPATNQWGAVTAGYTDGGATVQLALGLVSASGSSITFHTADVSGAKVVSNQTGWTNTATTKGLRLGWSITYDLN